MSGKTSSTVQSQLAVPVLGISRFPYHTVLFGAYPVMYLYAQNILFTRLQDILSSLAISTGLAVFFLLCFQMILKRWDKAGAISTLLVIMFFSFGHLANILQGAVSRLPGAALDIPTLAWVWMATFLALVFLLMRSRLPGGFTLLANITAAAFFILPAVTILSTTISVKMVDLEKERATLAQQRGEKKAEAALRTLQPGEMPDIYYIILDSYERADKLEELYGVDNSTFIDDLKDRGFYVASSSRSNYLNTTYSLNTALNLIYFGEFPKNLMRNARYNLRTNYVNDFLHRLGYQIVVFDSGTGDSNDQHADVFVTPNSQPSVKKPVINAFETLLIRTTIGLVLFKGQPQNETGEIRENAAAASVDRELTVRRTRIEHAFAHLSDYAGEEDPHFLFAHIYLPHMPFLYGPDGEPLKYHGNTSLYWFEPEPDNYIEQYNDQVDFLNRAVIASIDQILEKSERPLVIVLQSDHGDDAYLDWYQPTPQGVDARSATLNAIYFSDGDYATLYPTMTTVNTFRLVLNHWFGTTYPLLAEKVYFHKHSPTTRPGEDPEFIEACEHFSVCIPDPPADSSPGKRQ